MLIKQNDIYLPCWRLYFKVLPLPLIYDVKLHINSEFSKDFQLIKVNDIC